VQWCSVIDVRSVSTQSACKQPSAASAAELSRGDAKENRILRGDVGHSHQDISPGYKYVKQNLLSLLLALTMTLN